MPIDLPPSLDASRHPLAEEVAFAKSLTPEQRLAVVAQVCRAAWTLLSMHPKRDRVLALRDPVPESTRIAWKRLHAALRDAPHDR